MEGGTGGKEWVGVDGGARTTIVTQCGESDAFNSFNLQMGGGRKKKIGSVFVFSQQLPLLCALPLLFSQITCIFSPLPPLFLLCLPLHGRFGLFIQTSGSLRQPFVASHRKREREEEREEKGWGGRKMGGAKDRKQMGATAMQEKEGGGR